MEEAIKLAIEGGFKTKYLAEISDTLKPLFWQSLGKALGWGRVYNPLAGINTNMRPDAWKDEWHRFIDHLIAGHDAESFFTELLANKKYDERK